ncbi:MAG: DNA methyltransferase [Negativibacillus sp.]
MRDFEPIFYAEKAGHTAKWCGDRSNNTCWKITLRDDAGMATTLSGGIVVTDGAGGKAFISDKVPKGKKIRYLRLQEDKSVYLYPEDKQGAVWEVARETATFHPTQKPVELATRAIMNSSEPGDIILDLFGGSGFTLIGAEMTERQARLVELSPTYCDGIVRRYVAYTGNAGVTCTRDGKEYAYTQLNEENIKLNMPDVEEAPGPAEDNNVPGKE